MLGVRDLGDLYIYQAQEGKLTGVDWPGLLAASRVSIWKGA